MYGYRDSIDIIANIPDRRMQQYVSCDFKRDFQFIYSVIYNYLTKKFLNRDIIDLTSMDSSVPTSSKTVSVCATQQNDR